MLVGDGSFLDICSFYDGYDGIYDDDDDDNNVYGIAFNIPKLGDKYL